jgi:RimJ/RimL family protein N-acetyltransferase
VREIAYPELLTPRLRLRGWRDDDLEPLARLNVDPLAMRHMGRGPLSRDETVEQLKRMHRHWERHGFGVWAAESRETGKLLGRIGLSYHAVWPDDPEVGWFLDPTVWGDGLATEGGLAAARYGFETLSASRLVSICTEENRASRRVMEKLGFTLLTTRLHKPLELELLVHAVERGGLLPSISAEDGR